MQLSTSLAPVVSETARNIARETPAAETGLGVFGLVGAKIRYARNNEIYGEEEPADLVYKVISGAVRTYKLLADGRRQVSSFHLAGDVFGLEVDDEHRFSAEAIVDCEILVVSRSALLAMAERNAEIGREIWAQTAHDLDRARTHLMLLGRKNAQERVAAFLLEMAGRCPSEAIVELPMSRYDIADYLGLTIETVSRTITQLESRGFIELASSRRIVLRSPAALRRLDS